MSKTDNMYYSCASRGRSPTNPSDRSRGIPTEQRLEVNPSGISNAITTVAKDSYVLEIIPYDDYNGRIPKDTSVIGTITQTSRVSALRNGWKIIEVETKKANS